MQVDVAAHQVSVGGTILELQARQFSFLVALIRNPGKLLTYATLAKALGGPHEQDDDRNSWRILASKVRKQLGEGPLRPMIETERNVGYRLVVPATDQPIAGTGCGGGAPM